MNKGPIKLGVTGSIGMGKTTICNELAKCNLHVWNSDHSVNLLYKEGNEGFNILKILVPEAATKTMVDRSILSDHILKNPNLLKKVEKHIHPLIKQDRLNFINIHKTEKILVFEIPLLFETQCENWLDYIIVATAPPHVQKKRVLKRKLMTEKKFKFILSQQLSNEIKIKKADFILDTNVNICSISFKVKKILEKLNHDCN